jgi:hypothetical protein
LGIQQLVDHTALTKANEKRDFRIFADFGNCLIAQVQPLYANCSVPNLRLDNEIYASDSTSISVSINLFVWAEGKYSHGAVKMHTLLNLRESKKCYPEKLRLVQFYDEINNELLVFLTNNFEISALEVA